MTIGKECSYFMASMNVLGVVSDIFDWPAHGFQHTPDKNPAITAFSFLRVVLFLVTTPVAYYTMQQFLGLIPIQYSHKWVLNRFDALNPNLGSKKIFHVQFSKYSRFSRELGVFCGFFNIK